MISQPAQRKAEEETHKKRRKIRSDKEVSRKPRNPVGRPVKRL